MVARLALLLPGQGSQRPGAGEPWRGTPEWALVEEAGDAVGEDLAALLLTAGEEELRRTRAAQLATHLVSRLALAGLRARVPGLAPVAVAGHSLGELTALVAAGVLAPADGVRLVAARGAAMLAAATQHPGTMAALLGATADAVEGACARVRARGLGAWVANENGTTHVVVSGTAEGVAAAGEEARAVGVRRVLPLPVGGAFHSPLMEPALPLLQEALDRSAFGPAAVPVVSGVDGQVHDDGDAWRARLAAQLLAPVRWQAVSDALTAPPLSAGLLLECGPGGVLTGLARRGAPGAVARSVATPAQADEAAAALLAD